MRFSALHGCPPGENAYGYALDTGDGGERDLVEAYKWYALAMKQTQSEDAKQRAEVNMRNLLPRLTPEQIEEGKKRVEKFVPVKEKKEEGNPFAIGVS